MAEAVVGLVIGKLGTALTNVAVAYGASLLCEEASSLNGLASGIRKAKGELEIMEAYLHDVEKFKDSTKETTSIFVKQIRDLAFRIEDVIDEFTYKLEEGKHGGFAAKMKKRIRHIKVWGRLAHDLRDINAELVDAARQRNLYDIRDSGNHPISINNPCFAREEDLVGIEDNVKTLTHWLVGDLEEMASNKIATIWGMGGAGKTTLVEHVYKIVKDNFHTAAWVTVSRSYRVEALLKKIAIGFGIQDDPRNIEMRNLVELIRNHLVNKRYILVLDDVWEKDVWISIMDAFPTNCISRIVLTSRNYEVASLATSKCAIRLEPLEEDNSWKLFCKLAFRNNDDKGCPSELHDLAAKFLQKCEGLPLAIACIGRLLSCKPSTYPAWNNLYEELEFQSTNNVVPGVEIILKVSFEDLPCELKNCFLHCAIFPEDYEMYRRRLIRHWITAGFIKEKESKTLEQVAEGYLNELVNRSLLQIVKRNEFGRLKCCRMHDIIRRLALVKAENEYFGLIYDGSGTSLENGARRLSIQNTDITPPKQSGAPTHLRAIHAFTSSINIDLLRPILSSSKLLSTLDLHGTQITMLPNEVFSLFNLRFLGLRYTRIEILPEAIGRLQNLEVLDALCTALLSLPKNVAKLKKLRFLYACTLLRERTLKCYFAIKFPRGIRNLTGLHALETVEASTEILCDVAALTELRTFAVCRVRSEQSLNLCNAIMNMNHLVHLSIAASDESQILPFDRLCLPGSLSKLVLQGQLEKNQTPQIFSSWSNLSNLTKLSLILSKLDENSFSSLLVLRNLCYLEFVKAYDGKKLYFSEESFPRLRRLAIWSALQLNEVEVEEGALKSLAEVVFADCPELKCLPHGSEHLTALEELYLRDTAEELIEKLMQKSGTNECNEEIMKIRHVRMVVIHLTEKNLYERIR